MARSTFSGKSKSVRAGGQPPVTVANYVTEEILDGRYALGSRLDQQALADEFGASIIPVRESLRQLEAEGLVEITPRRGAYVIQPTDAEVRELYKLRAVLESFAATEAVPKMTLADLDELRTLSDELKSVPRGDANEEWTRLNRMWHFKLYGVAQSALLLQVIDALWDRCTLTSHAYVRDPRHRIASSKDHARILRAVEKGNADLAGQIISEHIHNAMVDLLRGGEVEVGGSSVLR
jgi:DNA-binding GntR family transcriptional regulator